MASALTLILPALPEPASYLPALITLGIAGLLAGLSLIGMAER